MAISGTVGRIELGRKTFGYHRTEEDGFGMVQLRILDLDDSAEGKCISYDGK